jgi:hypothetical protein
MAIAAGGEHSLALRSDGTVVAWGDNGSGVSTVSADLTGVIAIAAGGRHSLALKSDGKVVAWGNNFYGVSTVPASLPSVTAIAAGNFYNLAIVASSAPPALSISLTTTNILLVWPAAAAGYRLQTTPSLSPPVTWNPVTNSANLFSNRYELPLPLPNGAQFFRLINP